MTGRHVRWRGPMVVAWTLSVWGSTAMAQEAPPPSPAPAASGLPELPGAAQIRGLFDKIINPGAAAPAPSRAPAAAPAAPATTAGSVALQPRLEALNELKVDRACVQPQERFDVLEKALEYGGTNAQLRLQRLLATDFRYDDLTDDDRKMLKYLAYTTVWIPPQLETAVGKAWLALASAGDDVQAGRTGRTQRKALARLGDRLETLRSGIQGFPGDANILLDPDLRDGAFARVGGLVVISSRFLSLMDENDAVRDMVLAHELSHLYKRHTIKELQYRLISSAAGFQLVKKLLGKPDTTLPGLGFITGVVSNFGLAKELFDQLRGSQLNYTKEQELESDACALQWLKAYDIEPRAAWQIFAGILAFSGSRPEGEASYENLHPSPSERTLNIEAAMQRQRKP